MTTGHRYGGPEALTVGIVDDTAPEADVVDAAIGRLSPIIGKSPDTLGAIKTTMYTAVTAALQQGQN